jgi:hypothetical protein
MPLKHSSRNKKPDDRNTASFTNTVHIKHTSKNAVSKEVMNQTLSQNLGKQFKRPCNMTTEDHVVAWEWKSWWLHSGGLWYQF